MDTEDEKVKHLPGCPLCEHSDPELERVVREFTQWLYAEMLKEQKKAEKDSDSGGK